MNQHLVLELTNLALQANEKDDQYHVYFIMSEGAINIYLQAQPRVLDSNVGSITLLSYYSYMGDLEPHANHAIAELRYYLKYGVKNGYRLAMAEQLMNECEKVGFDYNVADVADYLDLDVEVVKAVHHEPKAV